MLRGFLKNANRYWMIAIGTIVLIAALCAAVIYIDPIRELFVPKNVVTQEVSESAPEPDPTYESNQDVSTQDANNQAVSTLNTNNADNITTFSTASVFSEPESDIYAEMHKMANSKIIADQIWGEIEITEERVTSLISEISNSEYSDKDTLLEMLNNWRVGNFSNTVKEHNYLWEKLNGTTGEAYGLR